MANRKNNLLMPDETQPDDAELVSPGGAINAGIDDINGYTDDINGYADTKLTIIGEEEIAEAAATLAEYKNAKGFLEERVVQDMLWYKGRHWEVFRKKNEDNPNPQPEPSSGWLANVIENKHSDAMDNIPEPVVLPRERSDEESARVLSSILPVIMEYNDFEETYSRVWYDKLLHGTGVYGVFWNTEKENGLGDIDIKRIDLLKIFWEPGINDIQDSRNLFILELVDEDILADMYPQFDENQLKGNTINVKEYITDDQNADLSKKAVVVDWYYKLKSGTKTVLHFCKFVGKTVLYASENDPNYKDRGYYDHGLYPVVFDCLFPEPSTPVGYGYVAKCKDPQIYIDKLSANIMESSLMGTKKRFFISHSTGINEDEFLNWNNPFVHVEGELGEERLREIVIQPPSPIYENILQMKIDEMKETSNNRDVNNGGSGAGVSAAAAISALQESGNKNSRNMISASYRAYKKLVTICIELIRQFYDEARSFRITGDVPGQYDFIDVSNTYIQDQPTGYDMDGNQLYRRPVFDLKVKAQKRSPFSRMEENERAKELYGLGFFNPERAQEALGALEMMDFEGKDKVKEYAQNGMTLLKIVNQLSGMMGMGQVQPDGSAPAPDMAQQSQQSTGSDSPASEVMKANTPMTSYGQRLAKRSAPDMDTGSTKDLAKK